MRSSVILKNNAKSLSKERHVDSNKSIMKRAVILFFVLIITFALASCVQSTSKSVGLQTIYGVMPVDLVQNSLSEKYFPLLVKAYRESLSEPDKAQAGGEEYPFQLFAIEPFENGVLLLAGYTIDQGYSILYYMEEGKIISQASDSEYFSLNYTVYKNHTISYGYTIDEGEKLAVKTMGTFASGEVVERSSDVVENYKRGYILIADGQTWLSSIQFLDKDDRLVTDQNSNEIGWNQSSYHWMGKPTYVWNVQRYTQMLETPVYQMDKYKPVIRYEDYEGEMNVFAEDSSAGIQYVWRGHNNLWNEMETGPAESLAIDNLPDDAEVYWVNIEEDDGGSLGGKELLVKGDLQTPKTPGAYCLLVKAEGLIYTRFVVIK